VELVWRLARRLADGRFHSGQSLAEEFGVSRSTVWNALRDLQERGVELHAVRGKGYRLPFPVDWFEEDRVLAGLEPSVRRRVRVRVLAEADSTNNRLLAVPPPEPGNALVCLAEFQTGGRGRSGRRWLSPPGSGICLSLAWQFQRPPGNLSALSIEAGLAVREALLSLGIPGVMLKWPNDLVVRAGKLGGLLLELRAEGNGPCHAVIGVGINFRLPRGLAGDIESSGGLAPADLSEACDGEIPDRNALAARIVALLFDRLEMFEAGAMDRPANEWRAADALFGRTVAISTGQGSLVGRAAGIDSDGALRLDTGGKIERITAGDVKVRPGQ
jgi:BirA family biotin operon repressor/biotin-[acetyl-CoA-carboxylase] ligase